ncbi:MAG: hypothetical protein BWY42_00999 [Candidatus Omnitrophica bacterium ADurb.Bin277]|nr:MAG: hypothetical protein BWY42_00999 [Candidatus Omnitrophica bacterium ADurb.Bin277]
MKKLFFIAAVFIGGMGFFGSVLEAQKTNDASEIANEYDGDIIEEPETETNVRDPFAMPLPAEEAKEEEPSIDIQIPVDLDLEGIGMGPRGAYVVLSGEVYDAGEEKKGIKPVKIDKREVELLVNGIPRTLRMVPEDELNRLQQRKEKMMTITSDENEFIISQ